MIENNKWVDDILRDRNIALIGFADISGIEEDLCRGFKYAVVIAIALDPVIVGDIPKGPSIEYYNEFSRVSVELKSASNFLTEKIRERGYDALSLAAQKQNADFRTAVPFKTLATRSGLGWIGKSAALITKEYGNAVRLNGVLTDMPVNTGKPVDSPMCGDCCECVINCPGRAIKGKAWDLHTDRDELLNAPECKKAVVERGKALGITEGSCGVCLAVCPWTIKYIMKNSK